MVRDNGNASGEDLGLGRCSHDELENEIERINQAANTGDPDVSFAVTNSTIDKDLTQTRQRLTMCVMFWEQS